MTGGYCTIQPGACTSIVKEGIVMTFTHVLVPTDFSEAAQHALRYALAEAAFHHAKVTLLHVLPVHTGTDVYFVSGFPGAQARFDPVLGGRLGLPTSPQPTVVLYDHHEEALTQLRDLMPGSFRGVWDVEVAFGPPADTIVRVAEKRDADLIVMGIHKHTGRRHMLLGRVAEKVARLAPCPVLTVRYAAHEAP
jgi:nucleotide-binding universal stress UspA family protein